MVIGAVAFYYFSASSGAPSSTTSSSASLKSVTVTVPTDAPTPPSGWSANSNRTDGAEVSDLFFNPDNITLVIGVNNSVTWQNPNSVAHTVTSTSVPSGASTFNLQLAAGGSVTQQFTVAGTYYYRCTIHPWMGGEIIVKSGSYSG